MKVIVGLTNKKTTYLKAFNDLQKKNPDGAGVSMEEWAKALEVTPQTCYTTLRWCISKNLMEKCGEYYSYRYKLTDKGKDLIKDLQEG